MASLAVASNFYSENMPTDWSKELITDTQKFKLQFTDEFCQENKIVFYLIQLALKAYTGTRKLFWQYTEGTKVRTIF